MYYGSQWNPFVITDFDMHDADLACRKLGYSYALAYAKVGTLGQVYMSINLLNVQVCVCYCGTDKKYLPQAWKIVIKATIQNYVMNTILLIVKYSKAC